MSYTMKEIIDIAVGIEETGNEFYARCAEKFKEPAMRDAFEFLAKEELAHKKLFQSFHGNDAAPGNFTEEYYAYLAAIGGSRVFGTPGKDPEHVMETLRLPIDAVRLALIAEKDSILFYYGMKGLYPAGTESSALLDRIISEERAHVITLADLSEKLRLM